MGISDWSSDLCSSDLMPDCWYPAITQWRVQPKGASVRLRRTIHCVMAGYQQSGMSSGCGHSISIMSSTVRVPLRVSASSSWALRGPSDTSRVPRSEEHTSELQSLMRSSYAVFCLKKKQHTTNSRDAH